MKKHFSLILSFSLFFLFSYTAHSLEAGTEAPFFRVKSGDGRELTLAMLNGNVVSLFYETRKSVEKNRPFKESLNNFFHEQQAKAKAQFVRVPVINCSEAVWPITKVWQRKLKENSEKEGITLYGDWDGKMFTDYGMTDNESNFIIIDKKGVIRYRTAGKIEDEKITNIIKLLKNLLKES